MKKEIHVPDAYVNSNTIKTDIDYFTHSNIELPYVIAFIN